MKEAPRFADVNIVFTTYSTVVSDYKAGNAGFGSTVCLSDVGIRAILMLLVAVGRSNDARRVLQIQLVSIVRRANLCKVTQTTDVSRHRQYSVCDAGGVSCSTKRI